MASVGAPFRISSIIQSLCPIITRRRFSTRPLLHAPQTPKSLPSISTCPPSTCACATMPEGLAIDYERQMHNTMPPYAQHVIIRTGKDNWSKRIEDELSQLESEVRGSLGGSNLAKRLKDMVGKGGKYHDVSTVHKHIRRDT